MSLRLPLHTSLLPCLLRSRQLLPIALGTPVRLPEWTAALELASTECWLPGSPSKCWANE